MIVSTQKLIWFLTFPDLRSTWHKAPERNPSSRPWFQGKSNVFFPAYDFVWLHDRSVAHGCLMARWQGRSLLVYLECLGLADATPRPVGASRLVEQMARWKSLPSVVSVLSSSSSSSLSASLYITTILLAPSIRFTYTHMLYPELLTSRLLFSGYLGKATACY